MMLWLLSFFHFVKSIILNPSSLVTSKSFRSPCTYALLPFHFCLEITACYLASMDAEGSDLMRNQHDSFNPGSIRPQSPPSVGMDEDIPTRTLFIGYPDSVIIDEQSLHNRMILFGEIEGIKTFPLERHALVKFRSIEEAQRAKEGLSSNDPRVLIMYSNSDHAFPDYSGSDIPSWRSLLPIAPSSRIGVKHRINWDENQLLPVESEKRFRKTDDLRSYIWHGIIAKGGVPVCVARCVAFGQGILSNIPEVIDCSARAGLEMLTRYYADAIGFDVVFFVPNAEEDFSSYTSFLRYLMDKNRTAVAKMDDRSTLFLVPPSDFLTKVLNIACPEQRIYGVVLKFPHTLPSSHQQTLEFMSSSIYANINMPNGAEASSSTSTPFLGENVQNVGYNPPTYLVPIAQTNFYLTPIPDQLMTYQGGYYLAPPQHPFQSFPTTYSEQPMVYIVPNNFQHLSFSLPPIVGAISSGPFINPIIPFHIVHPALHSSQVDQTQRFHNEIPYSEEMEFDVAINETGPAMQQATPECISVNYVSPEVPNHVQHSFCGSNQETIDFAAILQQIQPEQSDTQAMQVSPDNR